MATRWAMLVSLACATGVGCTATDIEGQDREMILPTARGFYQLTPRKDADGNPRRGIFGIEASVSGGEGDFDIDLLAGETLFVSGDTISGPATVMTDFRFVEASAAARGGFRLDNGFNLQGIGGVGYHSTRVDLRTATQTLSRTFDSWGPIIGLHLGWEVAPWLEIYGRGTILLLEFDLGDSQQAEVGARFRVTKHASLIAAYRWWRVQEADFSFTTDLDIRGGGLVVGLVIDF